MKVVCWSGGLDSTVLTYWLGQKHEVQPVYLHLGTVASHHQVRIVEQLSKDLLTTYPLVQPIKLIKDYRWQFSKFPREKLNRNLRICELTKKLGASTIYYGGYLHGSHFPEDNDWERLSRLNDMEVWNWERFFPGATKESVFKLGLKYPGIEIMAETWSCQMWYREPCRMCWACIEREDLFEKYS